jgi:hypothetical protein
LICWSGLVVTHVYGSEEQEFIKAVESAVVSRGGQAHFIRLVTHPEELERRVQHESRHEFKKLRSPEALRELMAHWDVTQEIPGVHTYNIDNTNLTPDQVVQLIMLELRLSPTTTSA